ncbi:hypothetical protein BKM03_06465 [Pseudomonas avellanae]|uniref:Uncharacterized protein n=1 Tax=Pseudomonas avellanae TaxID=46257 RepID=A0AAD0M688_9PSED|nr:hypothetical protein BKM03_06465 [Pseudomonas avellanae]POP86862.1 hypothetical protein CXB34_10775 [Pseudomonas amygdali pv. morsprunorum]
MSGGWAGSSGFARIQVMLCHLSSTLRRQ